MRTTGRATSGNLPAELTSFVGRRRELDEVKRLLGESRLVTLTGVGGTGKTRLALRAGAELRRAFRDGVWFVDLTQLRDTGLLTREIQGPEVLAYLVGATLGQPEPGNGSSLRALVEWLRGRNLLLILDNCEHLIPCCAIVADALLRGCPGLRLLATSREPLATSGEVLFAVPPLPVPDPGRRTAPAELRRLRVGGVVPGPWRGGGARIRPDRRQPPRGGGAVPPAGRAAAGDRAGRRPAPGLRSAADPRPADRPVRPAVAREPHRAGAAADVAGLCGLVLRPVRQAGAHAVGAAVGVRRRVRAGRGRGGLRRRAPARGGPAGAGGGLVDKSILVRDDVGRRVGAVPDAGDDPRLRPGRAAPRPARRRHCAAGTATGTSGCWTGCAARRSPTGTGTGSPGSAGSSPTCGRRWSSA